MRALIAGVCIGVASISWADTDIKEWQIDKLRAEGHKQGWTFDVEANWVTDYLEKGGDIANITGAVMPEDWSKTAEFDEIKPRNDLPEAFDWREHSAAGLQPIRNQRSCGSCWAFATVAVIESLIMIDDPTSQPDLAEQTIVSRCSNAGSCSGGWFGGFDYAKSPGLPDESQDPYQARNTSCRSDLEPVGKIANWRYVSGAFNTPPTVEQLKTAIFEHGPVAVTVNGSFGSYASGVYNRCNTSGINHMVVLEGWDNATESWIMRNSWGENWGDNGYMRIKWTNSRGYRCNNIGQHAVYADLTAEFKQQLRQQRLSN